MIKNEKLIEIVNKALDVLYSKDKVLIKNEVQEESIVSKFSRYLERILEKENLLENNLSVDNEYNRDILSESGYKEIIYDGKKAR
ncbi:MAG: hypothetical protein J6M60_02335 [Clostridia bacterium]|nr:hypothetical protein [Clostridia bacterium]